ncbi:hypothetical protein BKA69DRAFT_1094234 [Paraphysoderma sedebokerense]|nr:hypothetical protein BKA69DRAFT_1094234 [Paraphysoderma sedebokerense]
MQSVSMSGIAKHIIFLTIFTLFNYTYSRSIYVDTTGNDLFGCGDSNNPCKSIKFAINSAVNGDGVLINPGTYRGTDNVNIAINGKNIHINSTQGPDVTFVDGEGVSRLLLVNSNEPNTTIISGLSLINGRSTAAGCMLVTNGARAIIENCVFQNCSAVTTIGADATGLFAEAGGAIYMHNAAPTLSGCRFINNYATTAAGSVWLDKGADPVLYNCTFQGDKAGSFGGSVVPEGDSNAKFYNCVWSNNTSKFGGAIDTGGNSTTEFHNCTLSFNKGQRGGAVYHYNKDKVKFKDCIFFNNEAETNGGAVVVSIECAPSYENCTFENNTSSGVGAFYAESDTKPVLIGSLFTRNRDGGGASSLYARAAAVVTVKDTIFTDNHSPMYAPAILVENDVTLNITNMTCTGNSAVLDAGCLKASQKSVVFIANSTISKNLARFGGGGLAFDGEANVTIINTTIDSNVADGMAGAIWAYGTSVLAIYNSTILNNSAKDKGGAIVVETSSTLLANGLKVINNTAERGGGAFINSGKPINVTGDSLFESNVADFGGAFFFDSRTTNNSITRTLMKSNKARAGAVFFYNRWAKLADFDCTFFNNSASYGEIEATRPMRISSNATLQPGYSPNEQFNISVNLIDYFNNTATDTIDPVIAELRGLDGLELKSIVSRKAFDKGNVEFTDVSVAGRLSQIYKMQITTKELEPLNYTVEIRTCGPGHYDFSQGGDIYRCKRCEEGTYSVISDSECKVCPRGGRCPGGSEVYALDGFWLDPTTISEEPRLYRCLSGRCPGGSCAANRTGRLCSLCVDGFSEWGGKCQDCRSSTSPSWALFPFVLSFTVVGILIKFPRLTETGLPKSLVFFIQSALILTQNENKLTGQFIVQTFNMAFDSIISLDAGGRCVFAYDNLQKLAYQFYAPISPIISLFLWYSLMKIYFFTKGRKMPSYWNWRIVAALLWILLWSYTLACKAAFNLLNCYKVGNDLLLVKAPNVVCGSPEHIPYQIGATMVIIFFIALFPIVCCYLLYRARQELAENPDYPLCKELYRSYRPKLWYFEVVTLLRKLILTLLDVFIVNEAAHGLALSIYFFIIYLFQFCIQPFKNNLFNRAEDYLLLLLILMSGLSFGSTMRDNYTDKIDIAAVNITILVVGVIIVLTFILLLTEKGQSMIGKHVQIIMQEHPMIAKSMKSLHNIAQRAAEFGSPNPSRDDVSKSKTDIRKSTETGIAGVGACEKKSRRTMLQLPEPTRVKTTAVLDGNSDRGSSDKGENQLIRQA